MTTSKSKATAAVIFTVVLAIAAYWYWSPFLAIRQLQAAAQSKDADAFNDHVDYPKLRESMKGQFSAMIADKLGQSAESSNPFAALGTMLGLAMVNQVVDVMVRPEAVMQAMRSGRFGLPEKTQADQKPQVQPIDAHESGAERPRLTYERKGFNKLIAYAVDSEKPQHKNEDLVGLVFERSGFTDWKLTELRMPALNK